MAIAQIPDFDCKLVKDFRISCKECESTFVYLTVDYAAYPESGWCNVSIYCPACKIEEIIYSND